MNQETFEKVLKISEEFFGTAHDPEQMPINQESADKLASIHPDSVVYKFDEQGDPIAWVVAVPTSKSVKAIRRISAGKELLLYGWIYSPEGGKLASSVSETLGKPIRIRKDQKNSKSSSL